MQMTFLHGDIDLVSKGEEIGAPAGADAPSRPPRRAGEIFQLANDVTSKITLTETRNTLFTASSVRAPRPVAFHGLLSPSQVATLTIPKGFFSHWPVRKNSVRY